MTQLQLAARPQLRVVTAPAHLKGPRGDMENFVFARWLRAKMLEKKGGRPARYNAPFEHKWYGSKAQREMVGQDGGWLAPEAWRTEYFRLLRGGLILNKLNINIYTTKALVSHVPWGAGEWNFSYPGENATPTAADRPQAQQTFIMRKDTAVSTVSKELVDDMPADLQDEWLRKDAASALAHRIDRQCLFADGTSGQPVGLVNQQAVNSLTLFNDTGSGATPTYQDITNGIAQIAILGNTTLITGGAAECNGVIAAPRFGQTLDNINSDAAVPIWLYGLSNDVDMPNQPRWLGVKNWVLSALVPTGLTKGTSTDCSYLLFGDWRYFILMLREDFAFEMTDEALGMQGNWYQIKIYARYDGQAVYPFAFAFYTGVRG